MLFNGQPGKFALNLVRDYGGEIISELEAGKNKIEKNFPFEEKLMHYQALLLKMGVN